jgi:hypothetical protein
LLVLAETKIITGPPKEVCEMLRELDLPDADGKMKYKAMHHRQLQKKKIMEKCVKRGSVGSWGGLRQYALPTKRTAYKGRYPVGI